MKQRWTISLQNRLALTCVLFIGFALGILLIGINLFTGSIFNTLVKNNIEARSGEIVRTIGDQYNPFTLSFDVASLEAVGMYFVHEGYIVNVEDQRGNSLWDARACDMQECVDVINSISERMKGRLRADGALRKDRHQINFSTEAVGSVTIETYGPFFYSEAESRFFSSLNRLFAAAGIALVLLAAAVSVLLSRAIARPVNIAAGAARKIARDHAVRIDENYRTRELAELARSVNALAAELGEAERRQKQLTADIAHELRTPLTCLQGDIEAMIDGVYQPGRERLENCHEEIIRLAGLVRDLNTLTDLEWENITLNKTDFDLADLLRITAEQFEAAALKKGIAIHLNLAESPIYADYGRLKQVFINLLSNAVKYTEGGAISISIKAEGGSAPPAPASTAQASAAASAAPPAGGVPPPATPPRRRWEAAIADTGTGIAESGLPHIFERFYRADKSRSRDTGGAGIGLAIAAAIVRAHGGTIKAESGKGGSTFRVLLEDGSTRPAA